MSPHFHNRFYIINEDFILNCGVTLIELKSYIEIIKNFTKTMQEFYGKYGKGTGQAFVNVDKLHKVLT